jgi:hypothetical protein
MRKQRTRNAKTFPDRPAQRTRDLTGEPLGDRDLTVVRTHQAIIDEIVSQPVPYTLTPLAEAALEDAEPEAFDGTDCLPPADGEPAQDAADAEAARQALAEIEAGAAPIPWEKAELDADLSRAARQERRETEGQ